MLSSEPISTTPIVIEHTVTDGDDEATWHVAVDADGVGAAPGRAPGGPGGAPVVRLRTDRATAVVLADGTDAARTAFMRGDLQVGGDTSALVAARPVLVAVAEAIGVLPDDGRS